MSSKKNIAPTSFFSRSRELLSLGAKIAIEEVSHRVSEKLNSSEASPLKKLQCQVEQAKLMYESMGRLKGAAMKVGQMLSIEAQDFLPPEVLEILSKLQDQSESMDLEKVRKILANELGVDWESKITNLSSNALAAASIGQVHSAEYKGQKIALKIQYPGICKSIESDISILKKVTNSLIGMSSKKINTDELFLELQKILLDEGDYLKEGKNLNSFQDLLKNLTQYRVPTWIPEISTSHVLAMSFENGISVKEFLASRPSQELRNYFAQLVLDLYALEFFDAGMVQTDPNFANFMFRPESKELVVLDFGAVRVYSQEFRNDYKQLLKIIRSADEVEIVRHSVVMGLIQNKESLECKTAFCKMLKKSLEPFEDRVQPFLFSDSEYSTEIRNVTLNFTRQIKYSAPPHQLLFLHRKLGGIFSLLKLMNAQLDLRPYWQRLVS